MVRRTLDPRDEFRDLGDSQRERDRREQQQLDAMRRSQERQEMERRELETLQRLADVVNDPEIVIDNDLMKSINDPDVVMTSNGEVAKVARRLPRKQSLGDRFGSQFNIGMGFDLPLDKPKKRKGKKNPKLAAAFKEANRRYRLKNGKLRKGRTQADIARLAQRLRKKM